MAIIAALGCFKTVRLTCLSFSLAALPMVGKGGAVRKRASFEDLHRVLKYNPLDGTFVWKVDVNQAVRAGMRAGGLDSKGYWRIRYKDIGYSGHHLAFFMTYGHWPEALDHKDMNRANNAIDNLREATLSQNGANIRPHRAGKKGATKLKSGKFMAQIKKDGKSHYLGVFATEDLAANAYQAAAVRLFGEFARVS